MSKWKKQHFINIVLISLLSGTAAAQTSSQPAGDMDGWLTGSPYAGLKFGGNWIANDTHIDDIGFHVKGVPFDGHVNYDDGIVAEAHLGFAFDTGLRLEGEFAYRYNGVDKVSPYAGAGRGSMRDYAIMGNLLYDLPVDLPFRPYVGFGVGAADYTPYHIRGDGMPYFASGPGSGTAYPVYVGGPDAWGFAWQAIGGVAYDMTDNIALTLEYRYFERVDDHPPAVRNDYEAHSVLVGVRYTFGTPAPEVSPPPPPPPPPLPPPAARSYLVFFNFDKSDLTPEAVRIVDQAAQNAGPAKVTEITVTGHTDTVGSDAYNMRLSKRRAESVAAELEKEGIPASEIAIVAKGKRDLLVPTGDGVREPQNRRVQIVYGGATS
jgi:outer membrane protein OmpA-like peptidoglycan-associated protein